MCRAERREAPLRRQGSPGRAARGDVDRCRAGLRDFHDARPVGPENGGPDTLARENARQRRAGMLQVAEGRHPQRARARRAAAGWSCSRRSAPNHRRAPAGRSCRSAAAPGPCLRPRHLGGDGHLRPAVGPEQRARTPARAAPPASRSRSPCARARQRIAARRDERLGRRRPGSLRLRRQMLEQGVDQRAAQEAAVVRQRRRASERRLRIAPARRVLGSPSPSVSSGANRDGMSGMVSSGSGGACLLGPIRQRLHAGRAPTRHLCRRPAWPSAWSRGATRGVHRGPSTSCSSPFRPSLIRRYQQSARRRPARSRSPPHTAGRARASAPRRAGGCAPRLPRAPHRAFADCTAATLLVPFTGHRNGGGIPTAASPTPAAAAHPAAAPIASSRYRAGTRSALPGPWRRARS